MAMRAKRLVVEVRDVIVDVIAWFLLDVMYSALRAADGLIARSSASCDDDLV